jgi:hypothetical protein
MLHFSYILDKKSRVSKGTDREHIIDYYNPKCMNSMDDSSPSMDFIEGC